MKKLFFSIVLIVCISLAVKAQTFNSNQFTLTNLSSNKITHTIEKTLLNIKQKTISVSFRKDNVVFDILKKTVKNGEVTYHCKNDVTVIYKPHFHTITVIVDTQKVEYVISNTKA